MKNWYGSSVLSTEGWTSEKLTPLLDLAAEYKKYLREPGHSQPTRMHTCLTLFYEPSTRTRLSFECAAHHLGVKILSVDNARGNSSAVKGETLEDMGKILSAYADAIIIRHAELGSARRLASTATVPVINAGDGPGEHPTQALVDMFSIREACGRFEGLHVGLCGDLRYGRTIHSLLGLLLGSGCRITAIAPPEMAIPAEIVWKIPGGADGIRIEPDLRKALPHLDVLYMTRVQKERFPDPRDYERVRNTYRLTHADLAVAPAHLKIFHPLPRVDEVDTDVDADPRALYFNQSANGVPVRMALLSAVLGLDS